MHDPRPVTLVSGASRGIGNYLVRHFADQGHIVFGCSRNGKDFEIPNTHHIRADVTDEIAVKKMFLKIKELTGRLDNLINNAGIASMNHSLLTPLSTAQKVTNTNFLGTFLLCREGARLLRKSGGGRIVNFSTVAAALDLDGEAIYAASKSAVESLTRILAKELGDFKITVNSVGPTPIDTDLIRSVPKDKIQDLVSKQAIKRMGTFEDVQNVVDFFLSPESDFISGQTVYLGGVFK